MPRVISDPDHSDIPACMRPHPWKKGEHLIPKQRVAYAGMITFIDEQVGRIIDAIESSDRAKDTVVVFFSDHGIMEGDHGLMHKETLYKEVLNACLIIADPRGAKGKRVRRPVELLDLARTAMDLAEVPAAGQAEAFGESLLPLLRDRDQDYRRSFAIAQIRDATALVTKDHKYIETREGAVLFDSVRDPDELNNVAKANRSLCVEFQAKLDRWKETFVSDANKTAVESKR